MRHRAPRHGLVLLLLVTFLGCGPSTLTDANFAKLSKGMTKQEVRAILGPPDTTNVSTMPTGREEQWYYRDGKKSAAVAFSGDTVVHLGSTGLQDPSTK
jgi:outer membrane protein assembly factor BamE (lipoprotein component of BamABCDE complex)